jgi:hypothetical protein
MHIAVSDRRQRLDGEVQEVEEAARNGVCDRAIAEKVDEAKPPLRTRKIVAAPAKKAGQDTVMER